ncbi:MAG: DUF5069 domain-containing protein [Candidatus Eremiobacteraeota bacterium]|nr:DUF5069 domain-containing protein [Candidatus Eremiobacteraeota bacterium]
MEAIVPLISTSKTGPSGIMHLPRLWMKILLASKGRLAEGYRHGIGGFDERLLENFGVDRDAFIAYVESEQPDYLAAERWFTQHATAFSPQTVAASNAGFLEASFSDPARSKMFRERVGLDDDACTHVIPLNDLDDWFGFHESLVGARG